MATKDANGVLWNAGDNTNNDSTNNASPRITMQLASRKRKRTKENSSSLASSSSSSSSSDEDDDTPPQKNGWRVKLYRLNTDGSWDDRGTGRIVCEYSEQTKLKQEPTLVMKAEQVGNQVLLRSKVLLREAYQRQGDNIITWCEPYYPQEEDQQNEKNSQQPGVSDVYYRLSCF